MLLIDKTNDREPATLIVKKIGRTQGLTNEGYLLCSDVKVARVGTMLYMPSELPKLDAGGNRMLVIDRDADVLFDPECLASFAGKSVTLGHPDDMLGPDADTGEEVGVMLNPRRGDGMDHDHMVADLLIKTRKGIKAVRSGTREVSLGYDCAYEQVRPGVGRQVRIIGNHVALLPKGRCGPSCAISDTAGGTTMTKGFGQMLKDAFKRRDEARINVLASMIDEEPESARQMPDDEKNPVVHVHVGSTPPTEGVKTQNDEGGATGENDPLRKLSTSVSGLTDALKTHGEFVKSLDGRVQGMEKYLKSKDEAFGATEDPNAPPKSATTDSAALVDEWRDTISRAEMLAPGGKSPTFDAKAPSVSTRDALCLYRRDAMTRAKADPKRAMFVDRAFGGKATDIMKAPCETVDMAFVAASEFARDAANGAAFDTKRVAIPTKSGQMSAAKLQERIVAWRKEQADKAS